MKFGYIGIMKVVCLILIIGYLFYVQIVYFCVIYGFYLYCEVVFFYFYELYFGFVVFCVVDIQYCDFVYDGRFCDEWCLELYCFGNGEWRNGEILFIFVVRFVYIYSREIINRYIGNFVISVVCC